MCKKKIQHCSKYMRVLLMCCLVLTSTSLPEIIKIGGIFDVTDEEQALAFRYAIDRINTDNSILPRSKLSPVIMKVSRHDSFHTSKIVCDLMKEGVAAIIGPKSLPLYNIIRSICNVFEVPNIYTWADVGYHLNFPSVVNIFPDMSVIASASMDIVKFKRWDRFTFIYQANEDLIRYQNLLSMPSRPGRNITLRQLPRVHMYKRLLRDARKNIETNIILDIPVKKLTQLLRDARDVGMLTDYHNYLIASLDFHTVDFKEFHSARANITALRLVDPSRRQVESVVKDWVFGQLRYGRPAKKNSVLRTTVALLYDAISLLSQALQDLDRSQPIDIQPLTCNGSEVTSYGRSVVSYMKMIHIDGMTGNIDFDEKGSRRNITLDIVELHRGVVTKVGTWNEKSGVNYTREQYSEYGDVMQILRNKTLRVTTIVSHPFVMKAKNSTLKGNDRLEGYCIDLIKEISKMYGFGYEILIVKDDKYGNRNALGQWNGMMRQLIDWEADIAVADLTITYEREEVVDFTMPFMNFGVSILTRNPDQDPLNLFTFLSPLSLEVWAAVATAYLLVSLILYTVAHFTPYEWKRKRRNDPPRFLLENQFNMSESFWFTVGSFVQQGSHIAPRAMSTRVLATIWWFFTLVMLSSYTANLAAFLTVQRLKYPILSIEDLDKQSDVRYGCVEDGSTANYFKTSVVPLYKRMWTKMDSAQPSVFTKTTEQGIERALQENYAFIMESPGIEYAVKQHCNLVQTGGMLNTKGYGIATPPGSPYLQPLSSAILKLQDSGSLLSLKRKWWNVNGNMQCKHNSNIGTPSPLEINGRKIGGLFILLLAGIGVACIIAIVEYYRNYRKRRKVPRRKKTVQFAESHL